MKPIVTVTGIFPEPALEKLRAHYDLNINDTSDSHSTEELTKLSRSSSALITYLTDKVDRHVI